jgi:NAD(P)H-quinone oxidoreductase subunit 5
MELALLQSFFHLDSLALVMISLVAFVAISVGAFAMRYMDGDRNYRAFFVKLGLMVSSVMVMVSADHLVLLLLAWMISNGLLASLMIHKSEWKAAKESGILAAKNHLLGALAIGGAFWLLYQDTGLLSVKQILAMELSSEALLPVLLLIFIGAMTQSAIWPFHKWLTSSLNSPTPVSAMMHAGLVNGGGFLLARFAPLYVEHSAFLTAIFAIGLVSALMGTLWKLMQSDVKRMLAASTMGQMGFMVAQCGLGLFPAAIAHLVWHGMFKAYLFLASGAAAQDKRFDQVGAPKASVFIAALICGAVGSVGFAFASGKSWFAYDTTLVLLALAFITGSQFALPLLRGGLVKALPLALVATALVGLSYGGSVQLIAWALEPMVLMQPQPLNGIYLLGIAALTFAWLGSLFFRDRLQGGELPKWLMSAYVRVLNASQPHAKTITAHRNHYQY